MKRESLRVESNTHASCLGDFASAQKAVASIPSDQHENATRVCSVLIDPNWIYFMTCYEHIPAMLFV
ncbi:hypothetical protein BO79DRAFT_43655 [Aspergillus costaricaensis CBS 115574]|uniref:Uncharacterized protein n=1 Tax=Aspergillus costaricaensis CBS 115574 TaxID=1448317 RepID=A0ACD1IS07_9EURO|nr:hypothetical protein BO79DRAFT_43655 [Aspergillus costaricaensis CBS 115574]RAK93185.1 hypothetical protein BO79DRAFT_43655 [Aspergillus costaricaensis CBS 115574]